MAGTLRVARRMPNMLVSSAFGGVAWAVALPELLQARMGRYARIFRHTMKHCPQTRTALLTLIRFRRTINALAWVTRYKVINRQFARLMP